jgi:hypothetical protein
MKYFLILTLFGFILGSQNAFSQSLAINTDGSTANASAMLDVKSTSKGLLIPRMSKTEKNTIASPATGLLIFQNAPDSLGFYYYNGSAWIWLTGTSNSWNLSGNLGTSPATNFLGTTDNNALVIKTNNSEQMRLTTLGELGIGTSTPNSTYGTARLELASEGFGSPIDILIRNAVNAGNYAPGLTIQHARGTLATPLALNNGDFQGSVWTMNYDGNNYINSAGIEFWGDGGTVSAGKISSAIRFKTMDTLGLISNRMVIKNDGKIGISTTAPSSTLQVSGTLAVDVSMNVTGGTSFGSPVILTTQKSYIGLSPTATNNYYQLPLAPTCSGRIYYIRNNDNSQTAFLVSVTGSLICPGNSNCLSAGSTFSMPAAASGKTVMCVSDGINWTVMLQN